MLHLRLVVPQQLSDQVRRRLDQDATVTNLVVLPGSGIRPPGDLMLCDVARESASGLLRALREAGLHHSGSIAVENIDLSISDDSRRARHAAPGYASDALVWEEVEASSHEESTFSVTFAAFMILAIMIAAIAVLIDNPILVVGAMIVGPEYGPLAGICVGIVSAAWAGVRRSVFALAVGFPLGIGVTIVFTWLLTWFGLVDSSALSRSRPLTAFIYQPDPLSFVVAFIAGVAGMLALTSAKSGALLGVLVSVTTIPAAGNIAVALAYQDWNEAVGSAVQLLLNLVAIVTAGTLTLWIERSTWRRVRFPSWGRDREGTTAARR